MTPPAAHDLRENSPELIAAGAGYPVARACFAYKIQNDV
jgi:hypothetical protein